MHLYIMPVSLLMCVYSGEVEAVATHENQTSIESDDNEFRICSGRRELYIYVSDLWLNSDPVMDVLVWGCPLSADRYRIQFIV